MSDQYPIIFEDVDASKPTSGISAGVICYTRDTKKWYGWNGTAWVYLNSGGGSGNTYSFDNPPASPGTYDDEFESGSLDVAWTASSSGTTNPVTTGTINPISSLTTPVYDLATWPGWLLVQSDNSSVQTVTFSKTISLGTDATFFYKASIDNRNFNASGEGGIGFTLWNSSDSNEEISAYIQEATGAAFRYRLRASNNGVITDVIGGNIVEQTPVSAHYVALWKSGDTYHAGFSFGTTTFTVIGPVTKTGVTTFDRLRFDFYTANETPSIINGVDFLRYYPSVTYALRN